MSESEYYRESNYRLDLPVPNDVIKEQEKSIVVMRLYLYILYSGPKHLQN